MQGIIRQLRIFFAHSSRECAIFPLSRICNPTALNISIFKFRDFRMDGLKGQ